MLKKFFIRAAITVFTAALFVQGASAATTNTSTTLDVEKLKAKITNSIGIEVSEVKETSMPGVALLMTNNGLFYSSYDGEFLIEGKIYSVADNLADLSELYLADYRAEQLKKFEDDMIVYKAKDEKYVVTVFTDITCGYCRKMHNEMDGYNALGITFRYLAFPRAGIRDKAGKFTKGYSDIRSAWCSDNPAEALTKAKNGVKIASKTCENTIPAQLELGRSMGVKGTPAIILSNGQMIPGFVPPKKLEGILKGS